MSIPPNNYDIVAVTTTPTHNYERVIVDPLTGLPLDIGAALYGTYNVRAYGAKGDGTTDDSAAITAAIAAAHTAGGGRVFFPPGTYLTGTQTLYSFVHLVGAGFETTTIKLKAGTNADLFQGLNAISLINVGGGNVTAVVMGAGNTAGQFCTVVNETAFTITMDVSGTSRVANGTACVIAANSAKVFQWNASTSLWYPNS